MYKILLIGLGSALGGICRYGFSTFIYQLLGRNFPYGTLAVNVLGSFVMGFLFIWLLEFVTESGDALRALLLVGFLGGFTTFSSFSIETFNLIISADMMKASLNIIGSVVLCLIATWCGVLLGKLL